ncbi:LOW QUALITY PROTEIN: small secreted protein [Colletotrichum tofieldiae]|nr:LOW QUALITY PROTEIN: small secreted protein [Colletotrichum tofieldiae]
MYFSKIAVLFALAATGLSAPVDAVDKRQAKILSVQDYSQFQVSDGTGGNALDEVAQKFPIDQIKANLAGVSKDDLAILQAARVAAEDGRRGFNEAIGKASGADADALKVGKIKNKVLKLQLEVLALQVQQAQGADNQAKIDAEQKKLDNNVKTDKASAGKASQSVTFNATSQPKGGKI